MDLEASQKINEQILAHTIKLMEKARENNVSYVKMGNVEIKLIQEPTKLPDELLRAASEDDEALFHSS